jgi:hypothetical protein
VKNTRINEVAKLINYCILAPLMETKELFEKAVKDSESLPERPSNETLLLLYALFKQATEGDNSKETPENPFDFVKKAKHEAWLALKGKSAEDSMKEYIQLVEKLKV